jgi:signal transduction histidine kinase
MEAKWLRAVMETAVDGVILIDARGNVLMFNFACKPYRKDELARRLREVVNVSELLAQSGVQAAAPLK